MKRLIPTAAIPFVAATLAGAMLTAPAAATNVGIEWRDLNLETAEGQRALDRRIDAAARKACGMDEVATGSRVVPREARDCYRKAKAGAKAQVAELRERTRLGG